MKRKIEQKKYYYGYCCDSKTWICYLFEEKKVYTASSKIRNIAKRKLDKLLKKDEIMGKVKNLNCVKCNKWLAECTCEEWIANYECEEESNIFDREDYSHLKCNP